MTVNLCFVFQCRSFRESVLQCVQLTLNFDFIPEAFLSQLEVQYSTYFCSMLIQQSVQGIESWVYSDFRNYWQWPYLGYKIFKTGETEYLMPDLQYIGSENLGWNQCSQAMRNNNKIYFLSIAYLDKRLVFNTTSSLFPFYSFYIVCGWLEANIFLFHNINFMVIYLQIINRH